jgi:hypothetical protein
MTAQKNVRRFFLILGGIIIVCCLVVVACNLAQFKSAKPVQSATMSNYKNFETKNPAFDFTFEYPKTGWKPAETAGRTEKYEQIYLRGPVDEKTKFTTILNITVRPLKDGGTVADLLETYLKMDSNLGKFKVLHKEIKGIGGEKAFFAVSTYEQVPLHRIDAAPVPFKKQMIFLVRNERSYEFTLVTIASQYNTYAPILEHVLKTFKFK